MGARKKILEKSLTEVRQDQDEKFNQTLVQDSTLAIIAEVQPWSGGLDEWKNGGSMIEQIDGWTDD